jgi:hypothetical protein
MPFLDFAINHMATSPLIQTDRAVLHDGSDFHRKLSLGVASLHIPRDAWIDEGDVFGPASWALHDAIGPAKFDHFTEANIGIGEVDDGLLQCLGCLVAAMK